MIRVAIADDHAELRLALSLLLSRSKDIALVCEASNGREAVECVKSHKPDVLVMDVTMPELNGFEAAKQIARLPVNTRVILISIHREPEYAEQAAAVGAQGFVSKDKLINSLIAAIEAVYRGEHYFR
ncbi:MAG TPA: response regulator transcription factor [Anaerolineae bacterium]